MKTPGRWAESPDHSASIKYAIITPLPMSSLSPEDQRIQERAIQFARANKKKIAKERTSKQDFPPEESPLSIFMAGSPGAGKTETSKELAKRFGDAVVRIDADELRDYFPRYTGDNSHLFQGAASIVLSKIHDLVLHQRQSFILDGTLSNPKQATENVQRSIKRGRPVHIVYVYQDPLVAWRFVCARERAEGRRILKDVMVAQYFAARRAVMVLKDEFHDDVRLDLLIKSVDNSTRIVHPDIAAKDIDSIVPERYTVEELRERLPALRKIP